MSRAIEILQLIQQILDSDSTQAEPETTAPAETKRRKESDIGKSQPVGDYPDSPLRYGGMAKR